VELVMGGDTYAPTRWWVNHEEALDRTAPVPIVDTWILLIFDGVEKPGDGYTLLLPAVPALTFRMETVSGWHVSLLGGC
jgi:hypothetical protein